MNVSSLGGLVNAISQYLVYVWLGRGGIPERIKRIDNILKCVGIISLKVKTEIY